MKTAEYLSTPVNLTPFEIDQLGQRAAKLAEALFALKFCVEAGAIYDIADVENTRREITKMHADLDFIERVLPPRPTLSLPAPSKTPRPSLADDLNEAVVCLRNLTDCAVPCGSKRNHVVAGVYIKQARAFVKRVMKGAA